MAVKPVIVGVIGCGAIFDAYLNSLKRFPIVQVKACADLLHHRARAKAQQHGLQACSIDELLKDPEIEIVLNLTVPAAHAEVDLAIIAAGKHVHAEKPFASNREQGRKILQAAQEKDLLIGSAPDTFFGGGIQTCRKLIDEGAIGIPLACTAFMMTHGPEDHHPNPEFIYKRGTGPMFDMGPYYLTALINLLGPVRRVSGSARISMPQRVITSKPKYGEVILVEVPTFIAGTLDFHCGAIGTIITSFDVWRHKCPVIEIYGTDGTLRVPDPNWFGGTVEISRNGGDWKEVPLSHGYTDNFRGIGLVDMAYALRYGRTHRARGEMAFHVLDIMQSVHESSDTEKHIELKSKCDRPARLPADLQEGELDRDLVDA